MKTSLFDFDLPESLIATQPANPRDNARMLVVDEGIKDRFIRDLTDFLKPGDVMVFNDTRVIPARLYGKRGQAKIEVLLHKVINSPSPPNYNFWGEGRGGGTLSTGKAQSALHHSPLPNPPPQGGRESYWQCFVKPAKRISQGDRIDFADGFHATLIEKLPDGQVMLQFSHQGRQLMEQLEKHGHVPLPPYIEKQRHADTTDHTHYQTVYARHDGSVAAPTAGLHFTQDLLRRIDAMGVKRVHITLHVGGGTFLPVKTDDTDDHVMHSEYAEISPEAAAVINEAKAGGGRVIAVGTTSLRTLESASSDEGVLKPFSSETAIFITPGYRFKMVDILITNFHLPRSTLFMLVSAFAGFERMKNAYAHAIAHHYRFYSYGDACLLFKEDPCQSYSFR